MLLKSLPQEHKSGFNNCTFFSQCCSFLFFPGIINGNAYLNRALENYRFFSCRHCGTFKALVLVRNQLYWYAVFYRNQRKEQSYNSSRCYMSQRSFFCGVQSIRFMFWKSTLFFEDRLCQKECDSDCGI